VDVSEQAELVALAREFGEGELRPNVESWDAAGALPDDLMRSLAETGFLGMLLPDEYDGLGLATGTYAEILEAIAWADPSVALTIAVHEVAAHSVNRNGSDEVRQEWLPQFTSGETVLSYALHEEAAGTQMDAFETAAVFDGDAWTLDGAKDWVTNGASADRVLVFARTEDGAASFLVDSKTEGYSAKSKDSTMGLRAAETVQVAIDGVRVEPAACVRVGGEVEQDLPLRFLSQLSVAAISNGIARAALEHATRYSEEREQFGRALAKFGAIRDKLGEMGARFNASVAMTRAACEGYGLGDYFAGGYRSVSAMAASAKLVATETAMMVADEAIQIFGGYGYMRDYPVEKLLRDAHGLAVLGGNSDAMRSIVAEDILGPSD
jgi:alkylation response protein AidB-like acyl-CoA dehydrogenase